GGSICRLRSRRAARESRLAALPGRHCPAPERQEIACRSGSSVAGVRSLDCSEQLINVRRSQNSSDCAQDHDERRRSVPETEAYFTSLSRSASLRLSLVMAIGV